MNRVTEMEVWSAAGHVLSDDYGKEIQERFWDLGIPRETFLGLSQVPSEVDVRNLKAEFSDGVLSQDDFDRFCAMYGFVATSDDQRSAAKFLEFSFGRPVAWLHLPEGDEEMLLSRIEPLARSMGLRINKS